MGRWTLRHTDEVLVTKIETIITAAIRRYRDESDGKSKLSLSYESFVGSLDEDDHFVTNMIEILLKELADRRTRPTIDDRRFVSLQTSERMKALITEMGVYQSGVYNRYRNRSTTNLNSIPGLLYTPADSDEDEYGVGDGNGGIEGARIDSALYDVYSGAQGGNARGYPSAPVVSGRAEDSVTTFTHRPYETAAIPGRQLPVPHALFPRRWTNVFGSGPPPTSNSSSSTSAPPDLARRQYVYRPVQRRARTDLQQSLEFSEFAARRRSSLRQSLHGRDRASTDGARPASRLAGYQLPTPATLQDLPRAAIFDPPSPIPRDSGTRVPSPSPSTEADEAQTGRTTRPPIQSRHPSRYYDLGGSEVHPHPALGGTFEEWRNLPPVPGAPGIPLRRGGVQAPEMMLPPAGSILRPEPSPDSDALTRDFSVGASEFPSHVDHPEGGEIDDGFERQLQAELDAWSSIEEGIPMFGEDSDRQHEHDRQQHRRGNASSPSDLPPQQETPPVSLPTPRSVSPPPAGETTRTDDPSGETTQ